MSFAEINGAPQLTPEAVLGRPLWDFISDAETRHLYSVMFSRVRASDRSITVPFRCDSPRERRFLEITILPGHQGGLRLETRQHRVEARDCEVHLPPPGRNRGDLVTCCSWCKKVQVEAGEWVDVEVAVQRLSMFTELPIPQLTHGICPSCHRQLHLDLGARAP